MNESEFCDWLQERILDYEDSEELGELVSSVRTFEDVMMLTGNKGLVVKMDDKSEFQITVVRSR